MSNVLADLLSEVSDAEEISKAASAALVKAQEELTWFDAFDQAEVRAKIEALNEDLGVLAGTIASLVAEEALEQERYRELRSAAGSILNPMNWFNKEKKESRAVARDQRGNRDATRDQLRDQRLVESRLQAEKREQQEHLKRFEAFDRPKQVKLLKSLELDADKTRLHAEALRALYESAKKLTAGALAEFEVLSDKLKPLQDRLSRATTAVANLAAEKDQTQCDVLEERAKEQFGTVDLQQVISGCQAEMRSLEDQLAGVEARISETVLTMRKKLDLPVVQKKT